VYRQFIEHINEFSSEVSIESLKSLENEIAKKYIAFYVANPDDDQFGSLDEKSYLEYIGSHYSWAKKSIIESKKDMYNIDPKEALSLIENALRYRRISEDNAYKLKQISAKDYESLIKENSDFIQPLVKFLKMYTSGDVKTNIINALKSLKGESKDYAWKVNQIAKSANIDLEEDK
jgi:hypothetical protein